MADRYFFASPIDGDQILLTGPEAHHLAHVMRARAGSTVIAFDGSGHEFVAVVESVGRREVQLRVCQRRHVDRERACRITLGVPLPKGDRQKWLIEKLVELGVARFMPLVTEHAAMEPSTPALERLLRAVIEASKQCGRNRLMEIMQPVPLSALLAASAAATPPIRGEESGQDPPSERRPSELRFIAHPGSAPLATHLRQLRVWRGESEPGAAGGPPSVQAIVGPEGGFTPNEVRASVAAGWCPIGLGPSILRVETAALTIAAQLMWLEE